MMFQVTGKQILPIYLKVVESSYFNSSDKVNGNSTLDSCFSCLCKRKIDTYTLVLSLLSKSDCNLGT